MEDTPITNNHQLMFLSQRTQTIEQEKNKSNCQKKYEVGEETYQDISENENIKSQILKTFAANFMYCLILGSISLVSGILLSVISLHGLNTNKMTPVMGIYIQCRSKTLQQTNY